MAIAVPVLLRTTRRVGEVGFRTTLSHMLVGNPLRAVSSIFNIYAMAVSVSSRRRATAARNLGMERSAIAVREPDREPGRPGRRGPRGKPWRPWAGSASPEAVEALLRKFDDPTSDVIPQIARALREAATEERRAPGAEAQRLRPGDRQPSRQGLGVRSATAARPKH